jgi:hypothetical protein
VAVALGALALGGGDLLAVGCDKHRAGGSEPKTDDGQPTGLVVLGRGAAPRVKLRYRFRQGQRVLYRLTTERRRLHSPRRRARRTLRLSRWVDRVRAPRGDMAQIRWRVLGPAGAAARARRTPRTSAAGSAQAGRRLWLEMDSRGRVSKSAVVGGAPGAGGRLAVMLRGLHHRWPEAAVGVGARWVDRRRLRLPLGGPEAKRAPIRVTVRVRTTLERLGPCGRSRCAYLSLRTRLVSRKRYQRLQLSLRGQGQGTVVFDRTRGRVESSRSRAQLRLSTGLAGRRVTERYLVIRRLDALRNPRGRAME